MYEPYQTIKGYVENGLLSGTINPVIRDIKVRNVFFVKTLFKKYIGKKDIKNQMKTNVSIPPFKIYKNRRFFLRIFPYIRKATFTNYAESV